MPVACFLGRGKVHGLPAAVGTTVDGNSLWVVAVLEGMISKMYTNNRKKHLQWQVLFQLNLPIFASASMGKLNFTATVRLQFCLSVSEGLTVCQLNNAKLLLPVGVLAFAP